MKTLFLCLFLALSPPDSLRVMFWNLENCFDWRNDSTSVSDAAFSWNGERHWTRKRFTAKNNAIAKGILRAASDQGGLPDVIGLAEVENAFVLRRLLQATALRKLDYGMVHFDSPDSRGIDVALLYRKSRLQPLEKHPFHLYDSSGALIRTRDMLLVRFREADILVCHHPSKYGGAAQSGARRELAVRRLREITDSLALEGPGRIVVMGDFNDTPDQPVFRELEAGLENLALPLWQRGEGSIKYDGEWGLIDQIWMSPGLEGKMDVLYIPFLQVQDRKHGGTKPLRTYEGPRYVGGVSDHCPVWGVAYLKN